MAVVTIYVSRNGNSNNLKLRDSEGHGNGTDNITTDVGPGDSVQWELDTNSNLAALNAVSKTVPGDPSFDANSQDLLTSITSSNGVFTGLVVSPSPGKGKYEKYKIAFMVPNSNEIFWDDPKLQMDV